MMPGNKLLRGRNIKSRDPKEILKAPYSRVVTPQDNGTFMGEILEFHGCIAQGNTPEEALLILEEMAQDWIRISQERKKPIPEPLAGHQYSGKLALRMPKSIHKQAALIAAKEGASLNQFIVAAVAAKVGAEEVLARFDKAAKTFTVDAAKGKPRKKRGRVTIPVSS